jgi:hypothetical protein
MSHLGSEEYPPDAKTWGPDPSTATFVKDSSEVQFLRYWGYYQNSSTGVPASKAKEVGMYPYQYGYPWETVVKEDFTETTTKLYAHGRQSLEMSLVMPDEKTVYGSDDGTNCIFTMFVATTPRNLKEGKNFCMKMTQTSANDCAASDFTADVSWVEMPTPTHDEARAAIKTTSFTDLFDIEGCSTTGTCTSEGFKPVNVGACECLKVKAGKERLATVFEKRRYAGSPPFPLIWVSFRNHSPGCSGFVPNTDTMITVCSLPGMHSRASKVRRDDLQQGARRQVLRRPERYFSRHA